VRLWSIHPKYLDPKGLVALWREALLAQKVLRGKTKGYRNHPQLERFKKSPSPASAIAVYLIHVYEESRNRGYRFDRKRIGRAGRKPKAIPVTAGQIKHEFTRLLEKTKKRSPLFHKRISKTKRIMPHPLFKKVRGRVEKWEKKR